MSLRADPAARAAWDAVLPFEAVNAALRAAWSDPSRLFFLTYGRRVPGGEEAVAAAWRAPTGPSANHEISDEAAPARGRTWRSRQEPDLPNPTLALTDKLDDHREAGRVPTMRGTRRPGTR